MMPATVQDARDLMIASVLSDDPVLFIDDRWLYDDIDELAPIELLDLNTQGPKVIREGSDCTLVGASFSTKLCLLAANELSNSGISCEVVDLRVINPLNYDEVVKSVLKTGRLCVADGGWTNCGLAGEVIAGVIERIDIRSLKSSPKRLTTVDAPAPTSRPLEEAYYVKPEDIVAAVKTMLEL